MNFLWRILTRICRKNNAHLHLLFDEAIREFKAEVNSNQYDKNTMHKPTLLGAYNSMIIKHFTAIDENGVISNLPPQAVPSYYRFYRYARKQWNGDKVRMHKESAQNRRNNSRLLVGTSDYSVAHPMEIVEIDENETSVTLISANLKTPGQPLGHGIVYIAVCAMTRRIVGASVGFSNNSYEGFLDLMDSMMMTDRENAEYFGVEYDESRPVFPGCVLPREIRVDHGSEYVSKDITENLTGGAKSGTMEGVPIAINLAPVGMGSMKGIVEQFFNELHKSIQRSLNSRMGYVTGTHGSKHMEEAVLNIVDFRRIVYETIRTYNNSPLRSKFFFQRHGDSPFLFDYI